MHWGWDVAGIEDDPCVLSLGIHAGIYAPKLALQFTDCLVFLSVLFARSLDRLD